MKKVVKATLEAVARKCSLACNLTKKGNLAHVFACKFCEIFKNSFFTEHLRASASATFWKKSFPERDKVTFFYLVIVGTKDINAKSTQDIKILLY